MRWIKIVNKSGILDYKQENNQNFFVISSFNPTDKDFYLSLGFVDNNGILTASMTRSIAHKLSLISEPIDYSEVSKLQSLSSEKKVKKINTLQFINRQAKKNLLIKEQQKINQIENNENLEIEENITASESAAEENISNTATNSESEIVSEENITASESTAEENISNTATDNTENSELEIVLEKNEKFFHPQEYSYSQFISWSDFERTLAKTLTNEELNEREKNVIFQKINAGLSDYIDDIKSLLKKNYNEEEYNEMILELELTKSSSFFTPKETVKSIWEMVKRNGFTGGTILEPSMGIGNFLAYCPEDIAQNSTFIGIERDITTSIIAKALFNSSNVNIINDKFENVKVSDVDLVITNVPFENVKISHKDFEKNLSIHNFFIAKSLDSLKEGGIGIFITSKYTLDAINNEERIEIAKRGELIGAVRMPSSLFHNANVDTDILIFKKIAEPNLEQDFVNTSVYNDREIITKLSNVKYNDSLRHDYKAQEVSKLILNDYYKHNPDNIYTKKTYETYMLIGNRGRYVNNYLHAYNNMSVERFKEHFNTLTQNFDFDVTPQSHVVKVIRENEERIENYGLFIIENGQAIINNEEKTVLKNQEVAKAYIEIRDLALDIFSDPTAEKRQSLKEKYQEFKNKYKTIAANQKHLAEDPYYLSMIELDNENSAVYTKEEIKEPQFFENIEDALMYSFATKRKVDLNFIKEKTQKEINEIENIFIKNNLCYKDESGEWIPYNFFKHGDIYSKINKIKESKILSEEEKKRGIDALEAIKPIQISLEEININFGTTWIDEDIYLDFFEKHLVSSQYGRNKVVKYDEKIANWIVEDFYPTNVMNNTYGSYSGYEFLEYIMNGKVPSFKSEENYLLEQFKQLKNDITKKFKDYLIENHKEGLEYKYNSLYNSYVPVEYKGNSIIFDTVNNIKLRPNQIRAIERIGYENTVLLHHQVGTGKTFSLILGAIMKKKNGQINKPLIIAPNAVASNFLIEAKKVYPDGKFFFVSSDDMKPSNKAKTLAKIACNDFDLIIMSHSSFGLIPINKEAYLEELKREKAYFVDNYAAVNVSHSHGILLRRKLKTIENQLEKLEADTEAPNCLTFEQLGIDFLAVDEAHNFKNLSINGNTEITSSKKAFDLYLKIQSIYQKAGQVKNVVFATGTPVTNNIFELYNIMAYLMPDTIKEKKIHAVNEWKKLFLTERTEFEPNASSTGWVNRTRYKMQNVPEFIKIFMNVMDCATTKELNLEVPDVNRIIIECEQSDIQSKIMYSLDQRVKKIMNSPKRTIEDMKEDNLLKIVSEGSLNSLDPRLLDPNLPDFLKGKTSVCADKVYEKYLESNDTKGTQLIFCDLGTPDSNSGKVYETLTNKLIKKGIKKEEIAWMHDAVDNKKKQSLFNKMKTGEIRVLIGSTTKMGEGVNVQDKIVALHHLDVPWRPSDIEQREGRGIRVGNENDNIDIFVYATKQSFDSFRWNTVSYKNQELIPILQNEFKHRNQQYDFDSANNFEPEDLVAATAANPLIKEKILLEKQITDLHFKQKEQLAQLAFLRKNKQIKAKDIKKYEEEYEKNKNIKIDPTHFWEISLKGETYTFGPGRTDEMRKFFRKQLIPYMIQNALTEYELKCFGRKAYVKFNMFGKEIYRIENSAKTFTNPDVIIRGYQKIRHIQEVYPYKIKEAESYIKNSEERLNQINAETVNIETELSELMLQREKLLSSISFQQEDENEKYFKNNPLNADDYIDNSDYSYEETHFHDSIQDIKIKYEKENVELEIEEKEPVI